MSTTKKSKSAPTVHQHDIVIIGSGFSGLGMGIQLKKKQRHDFVILEKAQQLGGTWRDNHYPGAACDVPSHMYSFSFEQNPNWSKFYSPQGEILSYMQACSEKYQLTPHLRFNEEVIEARWSEATQRWSIRTQANTLYEARILISGIGALSRPAFPQVKGLEQFKGEVFHSANWNHDYDLKGKTVAVVGSGASAIQFVPQIQPLLKSLVLFQRTAPWLVPKPDFTMAKPLQQLFQRLPTSQRVFRDFVYWNAEAFGTGFLHPKLMLGIEKLAKAHLKRQIKDPILREKLTPNYTIGCKRVLFSNNYYPALAQNNVNVVASGMKEVTEHEVIASNGERYAVDAIICGTGFDVSDPFGPFKMYDRKGIEIHERKNFSAYLGIQMRDMPNFFMLLGPNTGLGHNSIIFMIEQQIAYTLKCLDEMDRRSSQVMYVHPEVEDEFNAATQARLKQTVWGSGGCKSWYLNEDGENYTVWPGFTWQYWLSTRHPEFKHFEFEKVPVKAISEPA